MRARKQKIDTVKVLNRTLSAKERIKKTIKLAEKFEKDPLKKERHGKQECPVCFYIEARIGGAMMCSVQCAICGEIMQFSSTATDLLCKKCANAAGLCRHCGGDIDVKNRRKINLQPRPEKRPGKTSK